MKTTLIGDFGVGFRMKYREGFWDKEILNCEMKPDYYALPSPLKVVVDIGAHIGGTAVLCAKLGAKVYAVEPDPENFELLLENISLNGVEDNVLFQNVAVGGKSGTRSLRKNESNSGGFGFFTAIDKPTSEVEVQTVTLAEVLEDLEYVDLLKMDCEGAEYEILFEADESLFDKIGQISMEMHFSNKEYLSPELAALYGEDYAQKLIDLLSRHFNLKVSQSGAQSANQLLCINKKRQP